MPFTLSDLHTWMNASEDEHLEFKEAKASYSQDKAICELHPNPKKIRLKTHAFSPNHRERSS